MTSSPRRSLAPPSARRMTLGYLTCRLTQTTSRMPLTRVWDAVAASGTDDHLVFLEHPELPEHWRPRSGRPAG